MAGPTGDANVAENEYHDPQTIATPGTDSLADDDDADAPANRNGPAMRGFQRKASVYNGFADVGDVEL